MSIWLRSGESKKAHWEVNGEDSLLCRGRISHPSSTHPLCCKAVYFQHRCSTCPHCRALLGAPDQGSAALSQQQTTDSLGRQLPKLRQFKSLAFSKQKQQQKHSCKIMTQKTSTGYGPVISLIKKHGLSIISSQQRECIQGKTHTSSQSTGPVPKPKYLKTPITQFSSTEKQLCS